MPLAQPAGVSEPPWMLPGNSSTPVSRQPMPRMWLSPSPRTLSQTPCRISVALLETARAGLRLSLSAVSFAFLVRPEGGRHDAVGAEHAPPAAACAAVWLAKPRLGRFRMNGRLAAESPRSRINSRRVLVMVRSLLRNSLPCYRILCRPSKITEIVPVLSKIPAPPRITMSISSLRMLQSLAAKRWRRSALAWGPKARIGCFTAY